MATLTIRSNAGFTLIEVMIVLLLIGLTSAFVSVVVESRQDATREVDRLVLALETAADQAMVRGTPVRFEIIPMGYRFSRLDVGGNWLPITDDPLLETHALPERMALGSLTQDGQDTGGKVVFGSDVVLYSLTVQVSTGPLVLVAQPSGTLLRSSPPPTS